MAKKILIIDDDADFIESAQALLEANNYIIGSSDTGKQGFDKAKTDLPDLIILDVMITDASEGLDIALQLEADPTTTNIPIVILTGIRKAKHLLESYAPQEKWRNVKAVLEKPLKPEEILTTLNNII